MLSIIISSYQPDYYNALEKNIAETCGIEYQIVKIHNPSLMGICEAYNLGAKEAIYDNLLFIHEDILFSDTDWGNRLVKVLQEPGCGVVGVAGGNYYSYVPGSWWNRGYSKLYFIQVDQDNNECFNNNISERIKSEVKSLDGVFLACTRKVYDEVQFDEKIDGYHGYDLIFSLKAAKKYKNYVTNQVLIKHFSQGTLSKEWLLNIIKVREIIGTFPDQNLDHQLEIANFYKLLIHLKNLKFNYKESLKISLKYLNPNKLGFINTLKAINRLRYL